MKREIKALPPHRRPWSSADATHRPFRLTEARFANVVARFLAPHDSAQKLGDVVIRRLAS